MADSSSGRQPPKTKWLEALGGWAIVVWSAGGLSELQAGAADGMLLGLAIVYGTAISGRLARVEYYLECAAQSREDHE